LNLNKIFFTLCFCISLILAVSCSQDPTLEVEFNFDESKSFVTSKNYDLEKWFELDSIFNSSVYQFSALNSQSSSQYISKVDSLKLIYNELTKEFYKNYFLKQIDKLKYLVGAIDFDNKLSYENFNDFFSKTTREFYDLNEKITPETRKEISEKIGSLYAKVIENKAEIFNENFKADFEDFKNQTKTTLQNLFK